MAVDVVRAESSRFRHPLLMIHGLWTGGWIWRRFAAYLGHRGWESWLPSFLEEEPLPDANDRRRALIELCGTLPAPPVLVAHDVGVAIAAALAAEIAVPAIVAIAPVWPLVDDAGALGVFAQRQFWGARLVARRVAPPTGSAVPALLGGLEHEALRRLRADSGPFFRALAGGRLPIPAELSQPGLVICASGDVVASEARSRRLAARCGWSVDVHETAGHFPMLAAGSEALADGMHRWLVRAIGGDLLAWLDDENSEE